MKKKLNNKGNLNRFKSQAWLAEQVQGVYVSILMLVLITCGATIGYVLIEGWDVSESFFMTVITLSTVGYEQVRPLSPDGQIFTTFVIVFGMSVAAYAFSTIGRTALQGELHQYGAISKMHKKIEKMKGHTIICGYGRLSKFIIPDLLERKNQIVVIDNNPGIISELQNMGIPCLEGSAYEDEVLIDAGIMRAAALLTLLPNDSDNVFTTLCARDLNSKLKIVARTESLSGEKKLRRAGANQIVSPYRVGASRAVQQLINPYINDFLEIATDSQGNHLVLEQIVIPKESGLANKTIQESEIRKQTGVTIAACSHPDGEMVITPEHDTMIAPGSSLIVIGTSQSIEKLTSLL